VVLLEDLIPARARVTHPPGSPIGAGFEVADGSYLVGGPLPYLYSSTTPGYDDIEDEGFKAWLLVTEPIRDVIDRYRTQAIDAGFEMSPIQCEGASEGLRCSTVCQLRCTSPYTVDYKHGRGLEVAGTQGSNQRPVSYLTINYREIGEAPYPGADSVPPADPPPHGRPGDVPEEWPPLPSVGDPIHSFDDLKVAPGTLVLADGLIEPGATTSIFEVVDDVETVMDWYREQEEIHERGEGRATLTRGGYRFDAVIWNRTTFAFYDPPKGPTILVLTNYVSD
jgi:hypothetical protein